MRVGRAGGGGGAAESETGEAGVVDEMGAEGDVGVEGRVGEVELTAPSKVSSSMSSMPIQWKMMDRFELHRLSNQIMPVHFVPSVFLCTGHLVYKYFTFSSFKLQQCINECCSHTCIFVPCRFLFS